MRMIDIIEKKRDKTPLTEAEISFFIEGYVQGVIPDYQVSSLLMAIYLNGMSDDESAFLTKAILDSGETLDLSAIEGIKVDKHSTGGVGDKTTLVLAPLVASAGVKFAKLSGRGLGHTGGTIDKLESFPGFNVSLSNEDFVRQVNQLNVAVAGQTAALAPADKLLYALRDVTGTVPSIPLIASSIMSKKLASGADAIVLDVKIGQGAFMKTIEEARDLSRLMVSIGESFGKKVTAFITNMDEPLGFAVGNKLEVLEAMQTLQGQGPKDLTDLCIELGSYLVFHAGKSESLSAARVLLTENIQSLKAYDLFKSMIESQGGTIPKRETFVTVEHVVAIKSDVEGYIKSIDALAIGLAAMKLGAGRAKKDDVIDYNVGVVLNKKVGDVVGENEPLAFVYANQDDIGDILKEIKNAFTLSLEAVPKAVLIEEIIEH